MSLRKEAARGVFWTATGNWGYEAATLIVFVLLSRLLTPEAFGLVALAAVFTALMKLIAEQGLVDAIVQRPDLETQHLDTAFWVSIGFGVVLAALLSSTAWLIASLVNEPDIAPVLAWMSLSVVVSSFSSVQRAILAREMRFASLTARLLASVVVGGIVGVSAALMGFGVWSLVAQVLTIEVVGVVTLWTASDWRPKRRFSRRRFRELFGFGVNVMGFKLLRFFNRRIDNLMVGSLIGASALGFYVIAYRLLGLLLNITSSVVGSVAFPVFSRIQDDHPRVQNAYYRSIRLIGIVSFPAFAGVIAIAPELTRALFGNQWDSSVPVMRVLAIAGLLQSIMFVNGTVLKSLGKPGWRLAIMSATAGMLVLSFAIAVQWGIVAVATAVVVVTYLTAPAWFVTVHWLIELSPGRFLRQIWPSLLATATMMAIVFAMKPAIADFNLIWRVLILIGSGMVTYGATLWIVAKPIAIEAWELGRLAIPRPDQPSSSE